MYIYTHIYIYIYIYILIYIYIHMQHPSTHIPRFVLFNTQCLMISAHSLIYR